MIRRRRRKKRWEVFLKVFLIGKKRGIICQVDR